MPKNPRMKKAVEFLKEYVNTYDAQIGYEEYSDSIFINDILYKLAIALDDKYKYGDGFDRFKREILIPHLEFRTPETKERGNG
jgi:hypothetical protein